MAGMERQIKGIKSEQKGADAALVPMCGPEKLGSNGRRGCAASCRLTKQLRRLKVSDSQGRIGRHGRHYNTICVRSDTETLLDERVPICCHHHRPEPFLIPPEPRTADVSIVLKKIKGKKLV